MRACCRSSWHITSVVCHQERSEFARERRKDRASLDEVSRGHSLRFISSEALMKAVLKK